MCNGVYLPHGVKRHLMNVPESVKILDVLLNSNHAISSYEIRTSCPIPEPQVKSMLVRMKNLGILTSNRINQKSNLSVWSVVPSLEKQLSDFIKTEYVSENQPVQV